MIPNTNISISQLKRIRQVTETEILRAVTPLLEAFRQQTGLQIQSVEFVFQTIREYGKQNVDHILTGVSCDVDYD
jgi:hypothetical protein